MNPARGDGGEMTTQALKHRGKDAKKTSIYDTWNQTTQSQSRKTEPHAITTAHRPTTRTRTKIEPNQKRTTPNETHKNRTKYGKANKQSAITKTMNWDEHVVHYL